MKDMDMDKFEDLLDDMQDMMEEQEEIQEIMGRNFMVGEFDEDALMGELNELDEEMAEEQLSSGLGLPSYIPASMQADKAGVAEQPQTDALKDMM